MTIDELITQYHYKPLSKELSAKQRKLYLAELPSYFNIEGDLDCKIYDNLYNLIAYGYSRVVIGDYGAYVEIPLDKMILTDIIVKPGQEYRFQPQYKNVKYHWYCLKTNPDIKIYYQKHPVAYADYKPEMFYISPYEIIVVKGESGK